MSVHGQPAGRRDKLRGQIANEAARLVQQGQDMSHARVRAARRVNRGWVPEHDLPDVQDIRRAIDPTTGHLGDRFDRLAEAVGLLASVKDQPGWLSGQDGLEHSLAVFATVHAERPFDEELLTAALVHDIGLAIRRSDPCTGCLELVDDWITPRTRRLLEMLPEAHAHVACTIGQRARRRLEADADFHEVLLLAEADRRAADVATATPSLEEAITILRQLDAESDGA